LAAAYSLRTHPSATIADSTLSFKETLLFFIVLKSLTETFSPISNMFDHFFMSSPLEKGVLFVKTWHPFVGMGQEAHDGPVVQ
jgi:hypothetical protein